MTVHRDIPHETATEVRCTRCGATSPKDPRTAAWLTFRWGCPRCARRRDLPDRPRRPTPDDPFPGAAAADAGAVR